MISSFCVKPLVIIYLWFQTFTLSSQTPPNPSLYTLAMTQVFTLTKLEGGDLSWQTPTLRMHLQTCLGVNKTNVPIKWYSNTPFPDKYQPQLDLLPLLDEDRVEWYLSHIEILRWTVELRGVHISVKVSKLVSFMCAPCEVHGNTTLQVYRWLRIHPRFKIVMDDTYILWFETDYPHHDWVEFYGDICKHLPPNPPEPLCMPVNVNVWIGINDAKDKLTCRSHTGVLIF